MANKGKRPRHGRRCGSKRRGGRDGTCNLPAGWGTDHPGYGSCRKHCGATPNGRLAAQRTAAMEACERFGVAVETDPQEALAALVNSCAGDLLHYRKRVLELDPEALTWGVSKSVERPGTDGGSVFEVERRAAVNVELRLYHDAQERLRDVAEAAIRCGVIERQVEIAEEQGQLIARIIRGILDDLNVPDKPATAQIVRKHLALVAASGDADVQ